MTAGLRIRHMWNRKTRGYLEEIRWQAYGLHFLFVAVETKAKL
jgi:hypothetical protein